MTVTRRQFLTAGPVAGTGTVAGCTDVLEDSLSSTPATASGAALTETGYAEHTVEEVVVGRTVGRFGLEHSIEARNWYAEYDRSIPLGALGLGRLQASVVSVLSTPQVSMLGKTFNPVGDYATDDLVELIQDRYDELEDVERVDETSISVLGSETTLVRYLARARLVDPGTRLDVYLQVSKPVAHDDDFVIGVAVYPQAHGFETESRNVQALLESVAQE